MQHILFISITKFIGGAEIVSESWLKQTKCRISLLCSEENNIKRFYNNISNDNIINSYCVKNIENKSSFFGKINYIIDNMRVVFKIKKIVKNNKVTVLYGNNTTDFLPMVLYKILINKDIKVVNHIHDIIGKDTFRGKIIRVLSKYVDYFIVPSQAVKDNLVELKIKQCKINVVYNSICKLNSISKVSEVEYNIKDKYPIIFIGAFNERKNIDSFLEIIDNLRLYKNNIIGIIVGRIEDLEIYHKVKRYVSDKKLDIIILNDLNKNQINYIYSIAKMLILTSNRDPLPTVILESMINRVLVYARDVDGVKEMIDDGITGYVYDYEEKIDKIIDKLIKIIDTDNKEIINNAYIKVINDFSEIKKINTIDKIMFDLYN